MQCELISWARVYDLSRRVAFAVIEDGFRPDVVVAIARGGYVPARILCDFLDTTSLASMRIEHYLKGADKQPQARVRFPLNADVREKRVLIADDVCDSGDTFVAALEHVGGLGAAEVRTSALTHKTVARFRPDYYAEELSDWRWLIFPWARMEDLGGFVRRGVEMPAGIDEIADYLEKNYGVRPARRTLVDLSRLLAAPEGGGAVDE